MHLTPPTHPPCSQARAIEKQIQAAKARDEGRGIEAAAGPTELRREDGQPALKIGLNTAAPIGAGTAANSGGLKRPRSRFSSAFGGDDEEEGAKGSKNGGSSAGGKGKGKRSVMEVLMEQERAKKAAKLEEKSAAEEAASIGGGGESGKGGSGGGGGGVRKDYWLRTGIVVKVLNKKVGGGKYYKKKGRIRKVIERYVGEVKMLDTGDRLRVDQEDLETVRTRCCTEDVFLDPGGSTRLILDVLLSCPCPGSS